MVMTSMLQKPRMLNAQIFSLVPTGSGPWSSSSAPSGFLRSSVGSYSYGRNALDDGGVLGTSSARYDESYLESDALENIETDEEFTVMRWVQIPCIYAFATVRPPPK